MQRLTVVRDLSAAIGAVLVYFLVRGLTEGSVETAARNSERVLDFERALRIDWESGIQRVAVEHGWLTMLANWVYIWGHWPVIAGATVWLLWKHRPAFHRFFDAFLISGAIGLLIFVLFPVAPPRLMDLGLVDTVTEQTSAYRILQPPAFVNQYAAMLSLHFGWNLLIGIVLVQEGRRWWVRVLGFVTPALMLTAVVLTANHYIIDAVAGAAVALTGLFLATHLHLGGTWPFTAAHRPAALCEVRSEMLFDQTTPRPLAIAHRAGNDLEALVAACAAGVDVVEADVSLYRGRLEVRHEKTAGPLPLLWDRWRLAAARRPRLLLEDLLLVAQDAPPLLLDLKGNEARLHAPEVQPVYSADRHTQLGALRWRLGDEEQPAVCVHERPLTSAVLSALHDRRAPVITWPLNTPARLRELSTTGIDGAISDDLALLRALIAQRSQAASAERP